VKHKPAKTRSKQEGSSSVKAKRAEKGKPVSLLDGWDTDPDSDADPDPKRRCRRLTDSAEVFSDRDDLEEDEGDDEGEMKRTLTSRSLKIGDILGHSLQE
jgi:hypothetical protein